MIKKYAFFILVNALILSNECLGQNSTFNRKYTYKSGDFNGIGKWYMGREIANVMGYQGISWLERSEREKEENVSKLIQNMDIKPEDIIADVGAGSGYHTFRMSQLANKGLVYAIDIQDEMLNTIERIKKFNEVINVKTILGNEKNINLPKNSVDKILMVDVYHEFNFPVEMIASIRNALRPDGQLFLIEYRGEDLNIPIKKIHKMTEKQSIMEMEAAGFIFKENVNNLPWQHCMVFKK